MADGFLHGGLGSLILKRLIGHAYGSTSVLDDSLSSVLGWMMERLKTAGPKRVDSGTVREWCVSLQMLHFHLKTRPQVLEVYLLILQVTALRGSRSDLMKTNATY